ncbi:nucleoside hydrolase [Laetiporus sulphureus 93-53]|uniref:Nucleoside hydrolase n=1 Tax=Laetiporus sulphureus 93-53 TaxID=1314785 RepID=A0A165DUB3_9APHY|nr:nucleoside hydrolase [Laetiporus sulphureus 93-53]KZT05645.1 nucleoside hydrolase [Laetiporus sulphureus 93-53]
MTRYIWLDCDPGHDDATAIMLAVHCPGVQLLGISTVHGNTSAENTNGNAARCLYAFAAPADVQVYPGATKPLIRPTRHDPEIHGIDGLGGVDGLPSVEHQAVRVRLTDVNRSSRAVEAIARAIRDTWKDGAGNKLVIVSSGPMTNIALFVSVYPDLLSGIDEFVFMGGGVGIGNRSPSAEFNILCDPEAAQIVLDVPVKKTMIPLNVTHTAIVTRPILHNLLSPNSPMITNARPQASTKLRHMLWTLISFFAAAYESTFGFVDGPPLHDALTIAYVAQPDLFTCKRYRVDVELSGMHTAGETVVDIWNYRACDETWGRSGKNCLVAEKLDVPRFFDLFLDCVARCDAVSPLNQ